MDYSLWGSSVCRIFQARILGWVAISFSTGSSWPRDQTHVFFFGRWILYHWASREAPLASIVAVQSLSQVNSLRPRGLQHARLKLMSIELMMPSNHLILGCCFSSAFNLSQHQGLFSESALNIRWPKYWSINPSNEYSGLISFKINWFGFLAVQGALKSLLWDYNSKASVLWCSTFFTVQLSHSYMTTWKKHNWLYRTLLAKWCLCFLLCCLAL